MHVWGIIEFYRNKSVYDSIRVKILPDGINLYCVEKKLISRNPIILKAPPPGCESGRG